MQNEVDFCRNASNPSLRTLHVELSCVYHAAHKFNVVWMIHSFNCMSDYEIQTLFHLSDNSRFDFMSLWDTPVYEPNVLVFTIFSLSTQKI